MLNFEMKYKVSEVAKLLGVDNKLIKNLAYFFPEYLNPLANPEKGIEREFTTDDLCTLSYILMYWEDNPDFENIRYGLNSGSQFEYPFTEIAVEATPIFREFSEEFIDSNAWIIGGMAEISSKISLADSYKTASDALVQLGIEDNNIEFIYPALYNYRHAIELYFKHILNERLTTLPKNGNIHNLNVLYYEFKTLLQELFGSVPPKWFENVILAFDQFDPNGTSFRYCISINRDEIFIDLHHLKKIMDRFSNSIRYIDRQINKNT